MNHVLDRECGDCTLCCKLLRIPETASPMGAWCQHCDPRSGCKIYDERPGRCRAFNCLWLTGTVGGENDRPNKTHVVLAAAQKGIAIEALVDPAYPDAWKRGSFGRYLEVLSRRILVAVRVGDRKAEVLGSEAAWALYRSSLKE